MICDKCNKDLLKGEKVYRSRQIVERCIVAEVDGSLEWLTIGNTTLEEFWITCAYCFETPQGKS